MVNLVEDKKCNIIYEKVQNKNICNLKAYENKSLKNNRQLHKK